MLEELLDAPRCLDGVARLCRGVAFVDRAQLFEHGESDHGDVPRTPAAPRAVRAPQQTRVVRKGQRPLQELDRLACTVPINGRTPTINNELHRRISQEMIFDFLLGHLFVRILHFFLRIEN